MTTLITIHILVNLIFSAAGYCLAIRVNKARMAKLANRNIDLAADLTLYKSWTDDSYRDLLQENESLRFQIQQFNLAKDQMKFTDQP